MRQVIIAVLLLGSAHVAAQPASGKFVGSWTGTLKQGEQEMEITIHIATADSGGYRAYFDLPAQNVRTMELEGATFRGADLEFAFGDTRYQGTVDARGTVIAGKLIGSNGQEMELDFSRSSVIPTLPATESAVDDPDGYAGDFVGAIEVGGGLEATIRLRRTAEGYAATMDVPAQSARGLSADSVSIEGDALSVIFGFGSYRGTFSADKAALDGTWTQGGRDLPFDLQRQETTE